MLPQREGSSSHDLEELLKAVCNTQAKFAILHQQLQDADKIIEHKSQAWSDCAFGFLVAALTSGYVSVAGHQSAQET
jgi:hypothetical protein